MAQGSGEAHQGGFNDLSLEEIEEIRSRLNQRKAGLAVNEQILFRHADALPPSKRAGVLIAGWGPFVIFPFAALLYFYEWKLALLTIFLSIFWVGMGRKYARAMILKQCREDGSFLKFALGVGLVSLT